MKNILYYQIIKTEREKKNCIHKILKVILKNYIKRLKKIKI